MKKTKSKLIPALGSLALAATIAVGCNRPNSPAPTSSSSPAQTKAAASTAKVASGAKAASATPAVDTPDMHKVRDFLTAPLAKIGDVNYDGMRYTLGNGLTFHKTKEGIPKVLNLNGCGLNVSKPSQKKLVDQIVDFMKDQPASTFENFKQAFGQALLPQNVNGLGFYQNGVPSYQDRSNFHAAQEIYATFQELKERYGDKLGQISAQDLQVELTTGGHMVAQEQ
jgi:hypothetical protein